MIYLVEDTVFNTDAEWIVNTINCVGVMGKGLALEFALRYPKLNDIYIEQCKNKTIRVGKIYTYEIEDKKIINFPTKYSFKYPSQYEWIEQGLLDFKNKYKELNIKSVAFPLLGCNNGDLDRNIIISMMTKILNLPDLDVYICKSTKLAGKEKEMLENFQKASIEELTKIGKLNVNQVKVVKDNKLKISRFYHILELDKIGKATYERLFTYFYKIDSSNKKIIQLSIYDI